MDTHAFHFAISKWLVKTNVDFLDRLLSLFVFLKFQAFFFSSSRVVMGIKSIVQLFLCENPCGIAGIVPSLRLVDA